MTSRKITCSVVVVYRGVQDKKNMILLEFHNRIVEEALLLRLKKYATTPVKCL